MIGLPSHEIFAIDCNGNRESIMCVDVYDINEFKEEVRDYINDLIKHQNTKYEKWIKFEYVNHFTKIFTIEAKDLYEED